MNDILHANIFFIIASVATVAFAFLACVAMYYVIKILASIRTIITRIEDSSNVIADDITTMRDLVIKGGLLSHLLGLLARSPTKSRRRRPSRKNIVINDSE